jgi:hypothetical protein
MFQTWAQIYLSRWRHISQGLNLHQQHCENLKLRNKVTCSPVLNSKRGEDEVGRKGSEVDTQITTLNMKTLFQRRLKQGPAEVGVSVPAFDTLSKGISYLESCILFCIIANSL